MGARPSWRINELQVLHVGTQLRQRCDDDNPDQHDPLIMTDTRDSAGRRFDKWRRRTHGLVIWMEQLCDADRNAVLLLGHHVGEVEDSVGLDGIDRSRVSARVRKMCLLADMIVIEA